MSDMAGIFVNIKSVILKIILKKHAKTTISKFV